MNKTIKIIGIVLLVILVLIVILICLLLWKLSHNTLPENYRDNLETGGVIEAKYFQDGAYDVSYYEENAAQVFEKYEIFYPTELESQSKAYPVIVACNGTGWPASRSKPIYEHYASWGFIVICTEETYSWNAFGAETCINHLLRLNEYPILNDKDNLFYQKIDFDRIGIIGHSQGGVGVINALTDTAHKDVYRAAVALSPTNKELAAALEWPYDATKAAAPILLISGEGGGDDWVVTKEGLTAVYDDIPGKKVMTRRKNTDHGKTQYAEDGYVVAWFLWLLLDDQNAAKAFVGENPEILSNAMYQDTSIDFECSSSQ